MKKIALILLSVGWLFAVIFGYYLAHKPFDITNALAIANALGDVFVAGALFILAAALGRRILRAIQFSSPLEALVFTTGLGLGAISFATFALGLAGLVERWIFWSALIVALIFLRNELRGVLDTVRAIRLPRATRMERALAFFCGATIGIIFLFALMPPTAWDALQYHLIGPQLALAQKRILPPPDNLSLSNPALVEMLFLAAMALKSDSAAQLMHWVYLPLLIGALIAFAQRHFSIKTGWLAAAILLATPSLVLTATWAYNDIALMFYGFAALSWIMDARATNESRPTILAGVFAGLALGEKYTATFIALALGLALWRPRRVILFAICAALVAAPWFIRNWIFVGNPVYPFIWGGTYWDDFRAAWYSRFGTGMWADPLRLFAVPWEATMLGSEGGVNFQATVGPLLLALLPLSALGLKSNSGHARATRWLWWYAAVLYVAWLIGVAQSKLLWQTRLLFPAFPALALLAGDAFERLAQWRLPQFALQRFTALVVGLVLALTGFSYLLSLIAAQPLGYLVGTESRAQYLARHLGSYNAVTRFVNTQLPPDANILFLWETRAYYFRRSNSADAILDRFAHLRYQFRDAPSIARSLRDAGYTHLLLHRAGLDYMLQTGYDPITRADAQTLQNLTRNWKQIYGTMPLEIITRDGKPAVLGAEDEPYAIYEIR